MKKIFKLLKQNFFAGILVLIPAGICLWVGLFFVRLLAHIPASLLPETILSNSDFSYWFQKLIAFGVIVLVIFGISFLGFVSKLYLGQRILKFFKGLMKGIPVLGTIYSSTDQLVKAFATTGSNQFSRVVYIPWPVDTSYTLGFVTGELGEEFGKEKHYSVFVPTVPNPTSGFYVIVPASKVKSTQFSVEEAFRTILSLGVDQRD